MDQGHSVLGYGRIEATGFQGSLAPCGGEGQGEGGLQAMGTTLTPALSLARARELGKLNGPGGGHMPVQVQERPRIAATTGLGQPWIVILFNDDYHAFDEVVAQVQKATGCAQAEAFQITYAAHTNGQAVAYVGAKPECERVASILREIDLRTEIEEA